MSKGIAGLFPKQSIPMDWIERDARTQSRVVIDEDTVAAYAEEMRDGGYFPPVIVFSDGTHYWIADGWHRFWAADRSGDGSIEAEVRPGTERTALQYALGANQNHGLRRTKADKRRAVEICLADEEWGKLSDAAIAEMCGVVETTVGRTRKRTPDDQQEDVTRAALQPPLRTGRDGKKYAVPHTKAEKHEENEEEAEETIETIASPYEGAINALRKVSKDLKSLGETRRGSHLAAAHSGMKKLLADVAGSIRQNTPVDWCKCKGKGCKACNQTGIVTRYNVSSMERAK